MVDNNKIPTKIIHILILGDNNIGKTSLIDCFINDVFNANIKSRIGMYLNIKKMKIQNEEITLTIYDCSNTKNTIRKPDDVKKNMDGIIIAFDLTNSDSYTNAKNKYNSINNYYPAIKLLFVGLKNDSVEKKAVEEHDINEFSKNNNIQYISTSAKSKENVKTAFETLAKMICSQDLIPLNQNVHNNEENDASCSCDKSCNIY